MPDPPAARLLNKTLPVNVDLPYTCNASPITPAGVLVPIPTEFVKRLYVPPTFRFPPTPCPPAVTNAPVIVLIDAVVFDTRRLPICTGPLR